MQDEVYMQAARVGQALSSPQRLRMINLLAQRPHRVSELADALGESRASASAHLKVLRAACLVADERCGREVWCRLASAEVARLLVQLRGSAESLLPELREVVREAQRDPLLLVGMTLRQLSREVRAGRVCLLDLRSAAEHEAGHLPGARSVPLESLTAKRLRGLVDELGTEHSIVAYCRGPWCVAARSGTSRLHKAGLNVRRLPGGVAEWQADGQSLATA